MRFQDYIIKITDASTTDLFNNARAVPADKQNWKPLDNGRTVINQLAECAHAPNWFIPMLTGEGGAFDWETSKVEMAKLDTLDKCEAACKENNAKFFAVIKDFPDSKLDEMFNSPWEPGKKYSKMDAMIFHYWNIVYHVGQINYIQTLLGDMEMH